MPSKRKKCIKCEKRKKLEEFHRNAKAKDGRASSCKSCIRDYHREYYKHNKRSDRYVFKDPFWVACMAKNAAARARKYRLPFDRAAVDEALQQAPDHCPALGLKLEAGGSQTDDSPTLDRIRPDEGYVRGNLQVISNLANKIKSSATPEQVERVARFMKKV